ncbi:hypothetical protein, partial [Salipiger sp. HF18]|uniref:hypothetical protein n=1 Tax=Salipiger sp. HF18 TaxID=2721557 RepID=UPI001C37E04C
FFELVVLPLWERFNQSKSAIALCCACTVMMDQMVDWIAVENNETPKEVRDRFIGIAPEFETLNLIARALKHRELDRGTNKGLRDVFCVGMPGDEGHDNALPPVLWPDAVPGKHPPGPRINSGVKSDLLLRRCVNVLADELGLVI